MRDLPERDAVMEKLPTRNEFWERAKRLGILDSDGNVDEARLSELADVPNEQLI